MDAQRAHDQWNGFFSDLRVFLPVPEALNVKLPERLPCEFEPALEGLLVCWVRAHVVRIAKLRSLHKPAHFVTLYVFGVRRTVALCASRTRAKATRLYT